MMLGTGCWHVQGEERCKIEAGQAGLVGGRWDKQGNSLAPVAARQRERSTHQNLQSSCGNPNRVQLCTPPSPGDLSHALLSPGCISRVHP